MSTERTIVLQAASSVVPGEIIILDNGCTAGQVFQVRRIQTPLRGTRIEFCVETVGGLKCKTYFDLDCFVPVIITDTPICKVATALTAGDLIGFSHAMVRVTGKRISEGVEGIAGPALMVDFVEFGGREDFFLLPEYNFQREFYVNAPFDSLPRTVKRLKELQVGDRFLLPQDNARNSSIPEHQTVSKVEQRGGDIELAIEPTFFESCLYGGWSFIQKSDFLIEVPPPDPVITEVIPGHLHIEMWLD